MVSRQHGAERRIIAEQAAQWVCDLPHAGLEKQAEFLAWLKQSPLHVAEYFFADTVWREVSRNVNHAGPESRTSIDRLVAEARAEGSAANILPLAASVAVSKKPSERARRGVTRMAAIAAGLAMLALALPWVSKWFTERPQVISTSVGEQRAFKLPDGSLLHLNAQSRVEVQYSERARRLRLLQGEALFTVQRDAARPFLVDAGRAVIQALGTEFNVYRRQYDTTVAVVSGAVQVSTLRQTGAAAVEAPTTPGASSLDSAVQPSATGETARLSAGQEVHITANGELRHSAPDLETALAWRERRLVFQGTPLAEVASEFNRYNERRIRIEGSDAREKRLSGTFDADDPDALMLFLRKLDDLAVEARDEELVIRAR